MEEAKRQDAGLVAKKRSLGETGPRGTPWVASGTRPGTSLSTSARRCARRFRGCSRTRRSPASYRRGRGHLALMIEAEGERMTLAEVEEVFSGAAGYFSPFISVPF